MVHCSFLNADLDVSEIRSFSKYYCFPPHFWCLLMFDNHVLDSCHGSKFALYILQDWPNWPTENTREVTMRMQSAIACSYGDRNRATQGFCCFSAPYTSSVGD